MKHVNMIEYVCCVPIFLFRNKKDNSAIETPSVAVLCLTGSDSFQSIKHAVWVSFQSCKELNTDSIPLEIVLK